MPLTVSDAMGILERAFHARNPNEIENILRDNLNVNVAVINSKEEAEEKINHGFYPLVVTVPYWVFKSKVDKKSIELYYWTEENIISERGKIWKLEKIYSHNEILPNKTYFILKEQAGYSPELGLTFEGEGEITGFEELNVGEKSEKFGHGHYQTWEEHSIGVWNKAGRILKIYRPFLLDWAKNIFSVQELNDEKLSETVDAIIIAIRISAFLHDIGKLRREWQLAAGWKKGEEYIARTSNENKLPFHAPYAYPFIKTFLRNIFEDDYRFLGHIALAAARHHSLEVTGKIKSNDFELIDNNAVRFLSDLLLKIIPELKRVNGLIYSCIEETNRGSLMDEPPTPSDDFYFIYTLTNRVVKFADWEDAGREILELSDLEDGGEKNTG